MIKRHQGPSGNPRIATFGQRNYTPIPGRFDQ